MQYEENKTLGNCSPDGAKRNPGQPRKRVELSRIALRSIRATGPGGMTTDTKKAPVETGA